MRNDELNQRSHHTTTFYFQDEDTDSGKSKVRRFVEPEATNTTVTLPAEPVSESPGMLTTQQVCGARFLVQMIM